MVEAQLDAASKNVFGVCLCENGFLHVVFSSLEDLLNKFSLFYFSAFQLGQSVYHNSPVACCSFLPKG